MSSLLALTIWWTAAPTMALGYAGEVKVSYATLDRAYFPAGERDGLLLGAGVKVKRSGNDVGSCIVDFVSAHRASCPVENVQAGDDARFQRVTLPAKPDAPASQPVDVAPEEAASVQAALAEHAPELVVYQSRTPAKKRYWRALEATLEHSAYVAVGDDQFQRERLDMIVDGLPLGFAGFRAYARASIEVWSSGASRLRLRPNETLQLYVWQLELSSREPGQRYALALGRIMPLYAPGVAVIDGVQAAYRSKDGAFELGVLGGVVPDAIRLAPRFDSYSVSAYYGHETRGQTLRFLRHSGRIGFRGVNNVGMGLELEEAADARIASWLDASAQVRLTMRDTERFTPRLELLTARVGARPVKGLELSVDTRYFGTMGADLDGFGAQYWMASDRLHVNGEARYRVLDWLALGVEGGAAHDFGTGVGRQYVGPLIAFPSLFGGRLGLVAAYREELGWARGRFVYAQGSLAFEPEVRVLARVSFSEDALAGSAEEPQREVGTYASVEGRIVGIVRWYAQTSFRIPLSPLTYLPGRMVTLFARAGISGTF